MTFLRFFVVTLVLHAVSARSPSLKQGGAACNPYTNYCMNGGTCYTQYTAQPASTASPATTTTTHQPTTTQYIIVTQPVCDCQPQYAGDRCEISTQITTDKPLSRCAAVQCLNGGECRETGIAPYVVCLCHPNYTGYRCETLLTQPPVAYTNAPVTQPPATTTQAACVAPTTPAPSPCASVQCLNGGSCRDITVAPFAICICPAAWTGLRCETSLTYPPTQPTFAPVTYTPPPASTQPPCTPPSTPAPTIPATTQPACTPPSTPAPTTASTTQPACTPPSTPSPSYPPSTTHAPVATTQPACTPPSTPSPPPATTTQPACTPPSTPSPPSTTQAACVVPTTPAPSPCARVQCLNGGSCRDITVAPFAICICPAQWTGLRCETSLVVITEQPVTLTQAPVTQPPVTYTYAPVTTQQPLTPPAASTVDMTNICQIYASRNMNVCQNGGQCVNLGPGKIACVCPSHFYGTYCEIPVYNRCLGSLNSQCHREHGTCQYDGSCLCQPGWCGMSCDQKVTPVTAPPSKCVGQCLNGATCLDISIEPFAICKCAPGWTGNFCETNVNNQPITQAPPKCFLGQCQNGGTCTELPISPYTLCQCTPQWTGARCESPVSLVATTSAPGIGLYGMITKDKIFVTQQAPRCSAFTITLLNDGAYTARMKVGYMVDNIHQPIRVSENLTVMGSRTTITIPWYATDVTVGLERYGANWSPIVQDSGIGTQDCRKCYKVWSDVSNPKWDHMAC